FFKINVVNIGDLQFSPCRRFNTTSNIKHLIIVKIDARYRIIRFGHLWFFFNGNRFSVIIIVYQPIALRVLYVISKDYSAIRIIVVLQDCVHTRTVENVVTQNKRYFFISDKVSSYQESIRQTTRFLLQSVLKMTAQLPAIPQ